MVPTYRIDPTERGTYLSIQPNIVPIVSIQPNMVPTCRSDHDFRFCACVTRNLEKINQIQDPYCFLTKVESLQINLSTLRNSI